MKTTLIIGLLIYTVYTYFRFKKKNKLIDSLRKTISDTHDYYREKYDFFIHFKERYDDIVNDRQLLLSVNEELKELLAKFQESSNDLLKVEEKIEDRIIVTKVKRSRKNKVE